MRNHQFVARLMKQFQVISSASPKWRPAPTRREQEKWDRATKATTGGTVCLVLYSLLLTERNILLGYFDLPFS